MFVNSSNYIKWYINFGFPVYQDLSLIWSIGFMLICFNIVIIIIVLMSILFVYNFFIWFLYYLCVPSICKLTFVWLSSSWFIFCTNFFLCTNNIFFKFVLFSNFFIIFNILSMFIISFNYISVYINFGFPVYQDLSLIWSIGFILICFVLIKGISLNFVISLLYFINSGGDFSFEDFDISDFFSGNNNNNNFIESLVNVLKNILFNSKNFLGHISTSLNKVFSNIPFFINTFSSLVVLFNVFFNFINIFDVFFCISIFNIGGNSVFCLSINTNNWMGFLLDVFVVFGFLILLFSFLFNFWGVISVNFVYMCFYFYINTCFLKFLFNCYFLFEYLYNSSYYKSFMVWACVVFFLFVVFLGFNIYGFCYGIILLINFFIWTYSLVIVLCYVFFILNWVFFYLNSMFYSLFLFCDKFFNDHLLIYFVNGVVIVVVIIFCLCDFIIFCCSLIYWVLSGYFNNIYCLYHRLYSMWVLDSSTALSNWVYSSVSNFINEFCNNVFLYSFYFSNYSLNVKWLYFNNTEECNDFLNFLYSNFLLRLFYSILIFSFIIGHSLMVDLLIGVISGVFGFNVTGVCLCLFNYIFYCWFFIYFLIFLFLFRVHLISFFVAFFYTSNCVIINFGYLVNVTCDLKNVVVNNVAEVSSLINVMVVNAGSKEERKAEALFNYLHGELQFSNSKNLDYAMVSEGILAIMNFNFVINSEHYFLSNCESLMLLVFIILFNNHSEGLMLFETLNSFFILEIQFIVSSGIESSQLTCNEANELFGVDVFGGHTDNYTNVYMDGVSNDYELYFFISSYLSFVPEAGGEDKISTPVVYSSEYSSFFELFFEEVNFSVNGVLSYYCYCYVGLLNDRVPAYSIFVPFFNLGYFNSQVCVIIFNPVKGSSDLSAGGYNLSCGQIFNICTIFFYSIGFLHDVVGGVLMNNQLVEDSNYLESTFLGNLNGNKSTAGFQLYSCYSLRGQSFYFNSVIGSFEHPCGVPSTFTSEDINIKSGGIPLDFSGFVLMNDGNYVSFNDLDVSFFGNNIEYVNQVIGNENFFFNYFVGSEEGFSMKGVSSFNVVEILNSNFCIEKNLLGGSYTFHKLLLPEGSVFNSGYEEANEATAFNVLFGSNWNSVFFYINDNSGFIGNVIELEKEVKNSYYTSFGYNESYAEDLSEIMGEINSIESNSSANGKFINCIGLEKISTLLNGYVLTILSGEDMSNYENNNNIDLCDGSYISFGDRIFSESIQDVLNRGNVISGGCEETFSMETWNDSFEVEFLDASEEACLFGEDLNDFSEDYIKEVGVDVIYSVYFEMVIVEEVNGCVLAVDEMPSDFLPLTLGSSDSCSNNDFFDFFFGTKLSGVDYDVYLNCTEGLYLQGEFLSNYNFYMTNLECEEFNNILNDFESCSSGSWLKYLSKEAGKYTNNLEEKSEIYNYWVELSSIEHYDLSNSFFIDSFFNNQALESGLDMSNYDSKLDYWLSEVESLESNFSIIVIGKSGEFDEYMSGIGVNQFFGEDTNNNHSKNSFGIFKVFSGSENCTVCKRIGDFVCFHEYCVNSNNSRLFINNNAENGKELGCCFTFSSGGFNILNHGCLSVGVNSNSIGGSLLLEMCPCNSVCSGVCKGYTKNSSITDNSSFNGDYTFFINPYYIGSNVLGYTNEVPMEVFLEGYLEPISILPSYLENLNNGEVRILLGSYYDSHSERCSDSSVYVPSYSSINSESFSEIYIIPMNLSGLEGKVGLNGFYASVYHYEDGLLAGKNSNNSKEMLLKWLVDWNNSSFVNVENINNEEEDYSFGNGSWNNGNWQGHTWVTDNTKTVNKTELFEYYGQVPNGPVLVSILSDGNIFLLTDPSDSVLYLSGSLVSVEDTEAFISLYEALYESLLLDGWNHWAMYDMVETDYVCPWVLKNNFKGLSLPAPNEEVEEVNVWIDHTEVVYWSWRKGWMYFNNSQLIEGINLLSPDVVDFAENLLENIRKAKKYPHLNVDAWEADEEFFSPEELEELSNEIEADPTIDDHDYENAFNLLKEKWSPTSDGPWEEDIISSASANNNLMLSKIIAYSIVGGVNFSYVNFFLINYHSHGGVLYNSLTDPYENDNLDGIETVDTDSPLVITDSDLLEYDLGLNDLTEEVVLSISENKNKNLPGKWSPNLGVSEPMEKMWENITWYDPRTSPLRMELDALGWDIGQYGFPNSLTLDENENDKIEDSINSSGCTNVYSDINNNIFDIYDDKWLNLWHANLGSSEEVYNYTKYIAKNVTFDFSSLYEKSKDGIYMMEESLTSRWLSLWVQLFNNSSNILLSSGCIYNSFLSIHHNSSSNSNTNCPFNSKNFLLKKCNF